MCSHQCLGRVTMYHATVGTVPFSFADRLETSDACYIPAQGQGLILTIWSHSGLLIRH